MLNPKIRADVLKLRAKGKTFSEINQALGLSLSKGTLSFICKNIRMPDWYKDKVKKLNLKNFEKARQLAVLSKINKRNELWTHIDKINSHLPELSKNKDVAKIILAVLYLAEGSKTARSALMFGNSDPFIIALFLGLLRESFKVDETRLRCTVQGRADQDFPKLEKFWSKLTRIPSKQFYKSRIDPRSIGKISNKLGYKGVCRIDYFSAITDLELKRIARLISAKYHGPMV